MLRRSASTLDADSGARRDDPAWAWATEHRTPEGASLQQLVSWLSRGELPPYTLVWKPGWDEWLPAMQVAELAAAFPSVTAGSWRVARARRDANRAPPPVPVADYPRLRLLAKDVLGRPTLPPFASLSEGVAPAPVARRALRDLDGLQQDLVTSQVPVAAMLERARAMKRMAPAAKMPRIESRQPVPIFEPSFALERRIHRGTTLGAPPKTLSPLAVELGFPALLQPRAAKRRSPLTSRRHAPWIALALVAAAALGLQAVAKLLP